MSGETDRRLLLLDAADNVLVATIAASRRRDHPCVEGAGIARDPPISPSATSSRGARSQPARRSSNTARRSASATAAHRRRRARPRPQCQKRLHADLPSRRDARPSNGSAAMMRGYLRADGRKGIRNTIVVAYLVECAHHVAREIAFPFATSDVHVIGFPGCYPNAYAETMMETALHAPQCRRGAAGLARLRELQQVQAGARRSARAAGRCKTIVIQGTGGTRKSIAEGRAFVAEQRAALDAAARRCRCAVERTRRRHGLRRLGRDVRHHRQSRGRPRLRPAGRGGRRLHLRGDGRTDRLRAHHGRARRHAGPRRANSRPASPRRRATTRRSATARSPPATPRAG